MSRYVLTVIITKYFLLNYGSIISHVIVTSKQQYIPLAPRFVGEINYLDEYVYQDNWKSYRKVIVSKNQVCQFSFTSL